MYDPLIKPSNETEPSAPVDADNTDWPVGCDVESNATSGSEPPSGPFTLIFNLRGLTVNWICPLLLVNPDFEAETVIEYWVCVVTSGAVHVAV